ncbi:uncharacterized protein LOC143363793 [Halictus rubicundus]|uniref:uncharacterized protein LOC143363793 n=1 Tax=Halictus rubicundus TaxID=77578 RepID=UPI004036C460
MTSTVDDLVAAQKDLGGRISRFLINLKKSGADNLTLPVLRKRRELLESYWRQFNQRHVELTRLASADLPYLIDDFFAAVEDAFVINGAAVEELIAMQTPHKAETTMITPSSDPEPVLPPMKLPTFSGDLYEWESFKDQFCSLVHHSTRIANVRKMQYLKSCLTGDAANMLDLTPITDANYEGAWSALERRFGNQRILSAAHMRRLITRPALPKMQPNEIKRLVDDFRQTQRAFQALKKPVKEWDEWFVFLASEKLDQPTRLAWEVSLKDPTATPTFDELESFLENRVHALGSARIPEQAGTSKGGGAVVRNTPVVSRNTLAVKVEPKGTTKGGRQCPLCAGNHALNACKQYKALPAAKRRQFVIDKGLCLSCLASSHQLPQCSSSFRCWVCDKQHNTTLHDAFLKDARAESTTSSSAVNYAVGCNKATLLATARVTLEAPNGRSLTVRALLDSGSEASFLSEWAAQSLRLRRRTVRVELTGYQGTSVGTARTEVKVSLRSPVDDEFQVTLEALVTKSLVSPTPSQPVSLGDWPHVKGLPLADPHFSDPAQVDVLLGADVCGMLLLEKRVGPPGTPAAIRTPFGWTLLGPIEVSGPPRSTRIHCVRRQEPLPDLQRFWELEELSHETPMSPDELSCEELFRSTTRRDPSGRYVVRLPFKGGRHPQVGSSRSAAIRMLLKAERTWSRDHSLRDQYVDFMEEYHRLGHMSPVSRPLKDQEPGHYLPHHAVWKECGTLQKIRVVFNASFPSAKDSSLNDALLPGPKLQSELWAVVTRWRLFRVAFSADIVKMFRQILIHPDDQDWLRVLWRKHPTDQLIDFRMTTVTYGTASAPYLAHRVLQQLAVDEGTRYPLGAEALRRHAYVDDILSGADDLGAALDTAQQLTSLLESGGFPLDKWASNVPELRSSTPQTKVIQESEVHGALGLLWDTKRDTLAVRGPRFDDGLSESTWTKRSILSEIARLFDPLGWLAPVIVRAKILLQDLWLAGVTWDQPLDEGLTCRWRSFRGDLSALSEVHVPRWIHHSSGSLEVELHGFCDASERAYAAAVYLVVRRDQHHTNLLVAKSRVAPVKTLSIPRLELCGAVLLAQLLASMRRELSLDSCPISAWTDSTVALAWLRSHPSKWKPFVAHRVSEIQNLLPGVTWRHVGTTDNPADLATRGIPANELRDSKLWWKGPAWLTDPHAGWPATSIADLPRDLPEQRTVSVALVQEEPEKEQFVTRFSSLTRLMRVTAYLRRFTDNCRKVRGRRGPLTSSELQEALHTVIRTCQRSDFPQELHALSRGNAVPSGSPLKSLTPFLGEDGILRVGGRLQNTMLSESQRHPAIINRTSHLALLVIRDAHRQTLHGGLNATLTWILRAFWIPRGRSRVKQVLRNCVTCTRFRASTGQQRMGNLPASRVLPAKPFLRTGVDYAGPLHMRTSKGRGHKSQKGYVAVFVCMVTKAVHLDAVTDLSAAAFIAAFQRFTARRGRCSHLYSDNGTTFRGADAELQRMFRAASAFYAHVAEALATDGTQWEFIPPYSPHMGGLWEAAVKSMKAHLRRVIGDTTLTYEEMTTLLCRVEACLNSRPLSPLSDDPTDLAPLTPGHFLVGEPLRTPPEPPTEYSTLSLGSRWRLIHAMHHNFWHRWMQEHLHQMQQRTKWQDRREDLRPGTLVLVKEDSTPPTRWPLARVESTQPGKDGLVRVVTLRSGSRTFSRTIAKLVELPIREEAGPRDGTTGEH